MTTLTKLANWLAFHTVEFSSADITAWLRRLIDTSSPDDEALTEQRTELAALLGSKPLQPYQMWSFCPDGEDLPSQVLSQPRDDLVSALGLGHIESSEMVITWGHRLPVHMPAMRPTVWDSDLNPWWRSIGRTEPLDGRGSGHPEVVHDSITVAELTLPIRGARP